MCFYIESDWTADVVEENETVAAKETKCDECRRVIAVGDKLHTVYQQEREECQACEEDYCDCEGAHDADDLPQEHQCECGAPDYGETFDWQCCDECRKFLKSIEAAEIAEGCKPHESQPAYTTMIEELIEQSDHGDGIGRYVEKAKELYPELEASGYLAFIRSKVHD